MLKFIGKGSCFNTKEVNNSAYYKKGNYLLLIDCGETIFREIVNTKLLDDIEKIDILITHFHSDHIGSLSSLLLYLKFIKKIRPTIIYNEKEKIKLFLNLTGIDYTELNIVNTHEFQKFKIEAIEQIHSKELTSYGYLINIDGKIIYYSGDSKEISEDIYKKFMNDEIDYFYQDVSKNNSKAHMFIEDLEKMIPLEKRHKVNCMHFQDDEIKELLAKKMFKI